MPPCRNFQCCSLLMIRASRWWNGVGSPSLIAGQRLSARDWKTGDRCLGSQHRFWVRESAGVRWV
jgi:hypothetical protein